MSKRYLGVICLLYSLIIGYVIIFDKLKNYLAPQMQLYIKLSLLPLIIIGFVLLFDSKSHYKFKISDLILLFPLFFIIVSNDGRLTSTLASNRSTKINRKVNVENKSEKKKNDEYVELPNDKLDNVIFDVIDETFGYLSVYLSFADKAIYQEGKTIRLKGFATMDGKINPDGYFSIGRYEVSCCVADASFMGFLIKDNNYNIKENKWYEVEGTLKKVPKNSQKYILAIEPSYIKQINGKNEEQYVYPCYSYGDYYFSEMTKNNKQY